LSRSAYRGPSKIRDGLDVTTAAVEMAARRKEPTMRPLYTPSTMPVPPAPDPLLSFIRQAQLALVYK
jgi:hypothetical protein